ncbi:right-handed parallel beta-helix repeat-containing protein [Paenibacillus oceani]|uniref:Right-handed parallel beta-helix repeat-containing protein n=1 Tax=Paenibacillus oceani TaxID=2772510 RepID=A0A927H1D0_9BACL|nr:right-handed parallel beta-helix repeat-containing protein [Paenibacillus oceani]MBD2865036.1 right-handed parallel beta-helix repeat-containing protein [Paenibacillus oceani]
MITWMGLTGAAIVTSGVTAVAANAAGAGPLGQEEAASGEVPVTPGTSHAPGLATPMPVSVPGAIVNVADFGAAGDGATDDSGAIQAAFDAVEPGGIVFIPGGTYLCGIAPGNSNECLAIKKAGIRVFGTGILKRAPNTAAYLLRISADRVTLDGLTLDGSRGAAGIADGLGTGASIRSFGRTGGTVMNCRFVNSPSQHIDLGQGSHRWRLEGNSFENFYRSAIQIGPEVADTQGCHYNLIANNHIKGDLPNTVRVSNGIFLTSSATTQAHDLKTCDHNVIIGNVVEDVADVGIESGYKCRFTVISDNTVKHSFNSGILVRDNQYTTVKGNTINCRTGHNGTVRQGIYIDGSSINGDPAPWTLAYCVVEGNTVKNGEVGGISVIAAQYSVVSNNVIHGVSNTNGSSGINIKSGFVRCFNNIIQTYQFGIRLSLEGNRPLSNVLEAAAVKDNLIETCRYGVFMDAGSVPMELRHADISSNRMRGLTYAPIASSTSAQPAVTNSRLYDNQEVDEPFKMTDTQASAGKFITGLSGLERDTPEAPGDTVLLFDKYVAGIVVLRTGNNETAAFLTDGAGSITPIAESANVGVAGSAKSYSFEGKAGAFVLKRASIDRLFQTVKATLL